MKFLLSLSFFGLFTIAATELEVIKLGAGQIYIRNSVTGVS